MKLKKRYGQHLLISSGVLKKILEVAQLNAGDLVVEIGPGTGNLTREILKTPVKELHCLEIDPEMIEQIKKIDDKRLKIHHADASRFDYCKLGESLKLLGNLPYNVASLILERTVFCNRCIEVAVFMVQKEVAEKLIKGYSWLSCFLKTFFQVSYVMTVPPRFFIPPPKVQSAVIKIVKERKELEIDPKQYKEFLITLFSFKRKTLKNKFPEEMLRKAGLDPTKRAEELSLDEIIRFYSVLFNT